MMKKRYITPQMEVLELETPQLMFATSGETGSTGTGGTVGGSGQGTPDLATGRRGTWGNLWK